MPSTISIFALASLALSALALSACSSNDPRLGSRDMRYLYSDRANSNASQRAAADAVSYWDGDNVSGSPSIEVHLSEQRAYFYKGDTLVGVSQVSTGREGYNTPPGNFKVIQKDKDHRSSLYGDYVDPATQQVVVKDAEAGKTPQPPGTVFLGASMPYFLRVHGGVGMHAGYLPGVPASHGCIRMPEFMAENFFNHASTGTPVSIVR
ncbi:MAG: L,D-transpeptidase family protein [Verrucomicrobia bacterium]|nr:L,D-transpeptidase family protein [Verrucomicrobiota bacterium]